MDERERVVGIDRLRGIVVFCMLFFIYAAEFPCLGLLSRVANNSASARLMLLDTLSAADVVPPTFLFLISLTYGASFRRRCLGGPRAAYLHLVTRYLALMGLGSILVSGEYLLFGRRDPFAVQTVLMFAAAAFLLLTLLSRLIKKTPARLKSVFANGFLYTLCALGLIGLALGLYDDFIIFFRGGGELYKHWSILHQIGLAGLLAAPFARLKWRGLTLSFAAALAGYTALWLLPGAREGFEVVVQGGAAGALGWLLMLLGGMTLMSLLALEPKTGKYYLIAALCIGALAFLSCRFLPLSVRGVSSNYMLLSLFIDAVVLYAVKLFDFYRPKFRVFIWWGRNPLTIFLIGAVFRGVQKVCSPPDEPLFALAFTLVPTALLTVLAYLLCKRRVTIKL